MDSHFIELLVEDPSASSGWRCLGTINTNSPEEGRKLGHAGQQPFTFTEPFWVDKGHRRVLIPASIAKPVAGITMLQKLEGRKWVHPLDPK